MVTTEGVLKKFVFQERRAKLLSTKIHVDDIMFGGMLNKMVEHIVQQIQSQF